ncbi:hypothetical protein BSL78_03289 [Apostichopus japonicus]|uniref:Uncharacterized protein n=1 Tax=Stichopus japonicus TaxID=307972 RepID=A0A2G8LHV7_STIJA|nr:hypothetical protein BSL78_03289 [Apostichopus japonicus]
MVIRNYGHLREHHQSGQSSGPYPKGTKVLIVETKLQGDILNLGIADVTAATKAVCYNKDIQQKLETGKTFLIRNFQKGRSCLIFNKNTKVTNAPAINNISENILDIARHLVNPPQPQLVSLKDVKLPKPGTPQKLMTITGEIVQWHVSMVEWFGVQPLHMLDPVCPWLIKWSSLEPQLQH